MTWLSWAAAAIAAACAAHALARLRRGRPAVVMMSALAMLGLSVSIALPAAMPAPVRPRPDGLAGAWMAACAGLAALWLFRGVLAAAAARGKARPALAIPAWGTAASGICLVLHAAQAAVPADARAAGAELVLGRVIPLACCLPAQAAIARLSWRSARRIRVRHIGAGMRAVAAAAGTALAATAVRAAADCCCMEGSAAPLASVAAGVEAGTVIVLCAGATVPAWWAAAAPAARQGRLWWEYWRLGPLWAELCREVPGVRLAPASGTWWNARYRLHRRVVEVRDAQLALRPYAGPRAAEQTAARAAGQPPGRHEAAAEAAVLDAAIRARRSGAPRPGLADRQAQGPWPGSGGPDSGLLTEAAALIMISRALRRRRRTRPAARGIAGGRAAARRR